MTASPAPMFTFNQGSASELCFDGCWLIDQSCPGSEQLLAQLQPSAGSALTVRCGEQFSWDSLFMSRLYQCQQYCQQHNISLNVDALPRGCQQLLQVATAVPANRQGDDGREDFWQRVDIRKLLRPALAEASSFVQFIGEISIGLVRLCRGRANTRWGDFFYFVEQAGPSALAIVTLLSLLVGMILAYLGLIQLKMFGAEIYVANLVTIGMMREMGALMIAVIMAGRTGAAYAAQLGTMQGNEEIDALTTLGISPIEFLVLPRMLALIAVMPLLCLYGDLVGLVGGAIVSSGMDITLNQYIAQTQAAFEFSHLFAGLLKSLIFAVLIAIAGCKAGIQSGRDSAAVGQATTKAVVTAIVFLVVADAGLNIIYDVVGL